jgi:mycothiol synthase
VTSDRGCDTPPVAEIEVHRVVSDRSDLVDAVVEVRAETDREVFPDDPPAPAAEVEAELFVHSPTMRRTGWVALVDGVPAGELTVAIEAAEENRHIAQGEWLAVRPGMRRRGVADALLRAGLDVLAGEGCTSLMLWSPALDPDVGAAYAGRLGLTPRLEERCSRLRIDDLDEGLLEEWIAEGRQRDDGYRVVQFVGADPGEHVDALVSAHRAMEDTPTEEMEWTTPAMTPAKLQGRNEAWERAGKTNVTSVAISPDGEGAGLSELQVNGHRRSIAMQGDTGVREEHRGRGLGRWLKAENLRLAREVEPRISVVETYNAQSNPWMLDINVAMGFRPHIGFRAFQGDLAAARGVLG